MSGNVKCQDMSWNVKSHEMSRVMKCQESWNVKCHEISNVKCQEMSWNVKSQEMSRVMKCQKSWNYDTGAGYVTSSRNTQSYTFWSVPSSPGRSFMNKIVSGLAIGYADCGVRYRALYGANNGMICASRSFFEFSFSWHLSNVIVGRWHSNTGANRKDEYSIGIWD